MWENGLFVSQYTYDDNGNRLTHNATTATYNDQDMMLSYGDNSYTYTANGDLMAKTGVEGTTTYTHDALGNLTQVNLPNNDVISYTYDGRNRLISKQVNGVTEYRLIYAGQLSPVAKVDASGNTIETYIYGLGVNSPDYIIKDGTKYRVIKDHLGSIRMIVNTSTGEVVKTLRYSEFGEITEEAGTFDTIFGFAGGIRDTDTSLTKFGARWYDPETGRWMEKEPLGFEGSDNFYSYCDGDPVNFVDLTGLAQDRASQGIDAITEMLANLVETLKKMKKLSEDAVKETQEKFKDLKSRHNGDGDAYRHCLWSCEMTQEAGAGIAAAVGYGHEYYDNAGSPKNEREMDLHNNSCGRDLGGKGGDCSEKCTEALVNGTLITINGGGEYANIPY